MNYVVEIRVRNGFARVPRRVAGGPHSSPFPKQSSLVNTNVNVMSTADEQIRVSAETKRELERRKREGESFDDVLERLLEDDRDLLAGFGSWSDEQAEAAREIRKRSKNRSKELMERVAGADEGS